MVPRILIADDQVAILRSLRTLLESKLRFEVCGTALNGSEAVVKARELHPDVIILDLAMPVMNGLEAAREIARLQPEIPMLLYTITDLPQVQDEAAGAGIREVVGKAAAPQVLLDAVDRAFGKPAPVASPDGSMSPLPPAVTPIDGQHALAKPKAADLPKLDRAKAS